MNGVILNTSIDQEIMKFPQVDFQIEAVIHCAPTPPKCLYLFVYFLRNEAKAIGYWQFIFGLSLTDKKQTE